MRRLVRDVTKSRVLSKTRPAEKTFLCGSPSLENLQFLVSPLMHFGCHVEQQLNLKLSMCYITLMPIQQKKEKDCLRDLGHSNHIAKWPVTWIIVCQCCARRKWRPIPPSLPSLLIVLSHHFKGWIVKVRDYPIDSQKILFSAPCSGQCESHREPVCTTVVCLVVIYFFSNLTRCKTILFISNRNVQSSSTNPDVSSSTVYPFILLLTPNVFLNLVPTRFRVQNSRS